MNDQKTVGVKELKNQTTQIIRLVRESGAEFIVTVDGKPAALIRPFTNQDSANYRTERMKAFLRNAEALSKDIAKSWNSNLSAPDAVAAQRR